jgi:hypothetical protein
MNPSSSVRLIDIRVSSIKVRLNYYGACFLEHNTLRIFLYDRHVGVRPRLMWVNLRESFECWVTGARIDLESVVLKLSSGLNDCNGIVKVNLDFVVVGASLYSGCSGARCTFAPRRACHLPHTAEPCSQLYIGPFKPSFRNP